jgi:hypothetical protein
MIHPVSSLRRHRRLLALCGLSALVHLALLELYAAHAPAPAAGPAADSLVLRLAPPASRPAAAPAPSQRPAAPPVRAEAAGAALPAAPAVKAAAKATPSAATPAAVAGSAGDAGIAPQPLVQMPSRYRVRMPDPVLLTYVQTRAAPGSAPLRLADAHIDWRTDGERYQLDIDGVLGRLGSEGASGDAGVAPRRASEERDGRQLVTEFGPGQVHFVASGASAPDSIGIQDRASLLMQLTGIGLGEPGQVKDVIEVVVAGEAGTSIVRFQVLEVESVATPLGQIEAWHLAQRAAPGQPRLEVWLAPSRAWLPVQLRLTGADGAAATQTLSAIAAPPAVP